MFLPAGCHTTRRHIRSQRTLILDEDLHISWHPGLSLCLCHGQTTTNTTSSCRVACARSAVLSIIADAVDRVDSSIHSSTPPSLPLAVYSSTNSTPSLLAGSQNMPLSDSSPPPLRCSPSSHRNCKKNHPAACSKLGPASSPGAVALACFPPSLDSYPYSPAHWRCCHCCALRQLRFRPGQSLQAAAIITGLGKPCL